MAHNGTFKPQVCQHSVNTFEIGYKIRWSPPSQPHAPRSARRPSHDPPGAADAPSAILQPQAAAQEARTLHGQLGPFRPRECRRRQPRATVAAIVPRPPPHFAAVGGSTPFGLRPLGAGGLPRTRPPRQIHRAPRAPGLRSSAPRSRPSRTPPSRRRGPRLPGARSPTTSPSWRPTAPFPDPPTPRRLRHPLPSFLPKPHLPAADHRQGPLDRLMRSRPPSRPGVTHPPIMSTLGRTPRRGDGRLLFMLVAAPPLRGLTGRSNPGNGDPRGAPRAEPTAALHRRRDSFRHYCRYRSTWLAPSFVRLVLRKRS